MKYLLLWNTSKELFRLIGMFVPSRKLMNTYMYDQNRVESDSVPILYILFYYGNLNKNTVILHTWRSASCDPFPSWQTSPDSKVHPSDRTLSLVIYVGDPIWWWSTVLTSLTYNSFTIYRIYLLYNNVQQCSFTYILFYNW